MRKKIRLAQSKDDLHDIGSDDLLSRLPDDILVSILSVLPLKDAIVTSKLARRWRYLWCQTGCLDFDDKERSLKIRRECGLSNLKMRNMYINWVNRIIRQHKSASIDKFKICFELNNNAKGAIRKWIEFAISKNVQTLELDLRQNDYNVNNFVFPNTIFDRKCGSSLKRSSFNVSSRPYAAVMEMKFLKALILKYVDVDDEGLKKILSNCPVLEHLSIHGSCKLVKAKIVGNVLALKTIEFGGACSRLESIEICDSNIVSINCEGFSFGGLITLRVDNLQKLEKFCIGKAYAWKKSSHSFCHISCCVPYLQVLELDLFCLQSFFRGSIELFSFLELPKLKQLIVDGETWYKDSLLLLTSLVEACPNLQRFRIQLSWFTWVERELTNREVRQMAGYPHQHLEVVEINGYRGVDCDFRLAMFLIEKGVALKKLVIEPYTIPGLAANETTQEKNVVRYRAHQQLEPKTPVGVELVIL